MVFCSYFVSLSTLSFRLIFLWHLSLLFPHCSWKFQCMIRITFYLTAYQLINIWVVYISFCYYEQECTMWIIMYNHVRLFINKYFYSRGVYLHEISRSCSNTTFRFWRNCQSYVCSKYTASFYIPFNNVHEWMSPNLMNSYFRKCHTPSLKGKRKEV